MRVLWLEDLIRCALEHASTVDDILLLRKHVLWQLADFILTEKGWKGAWHEVRTGTSGNRFLNP